MAEFHTVARTADIPPGRAKAVRVGNKTVAVFHHGGQFYALDDMCPHMGASLAEGVVEDGAVTCSWHAWRFRLSDGTWLNSPRVKTGCYAVRVVGDEVQVEV
jgi:nitrite reductase (NADH) small subunit/3-phenylpropionate/trans-cinnamate dioxygenase ferredoxin subunit